MQDKCRDRSWELNGVFNNRKELKVAGAPCIHYYMMSNSEQVKRIANEIF